MQTTPLLTGEVLETEVQVLEFWGRFKDGAVASQSLLLASIENRKDNMPGTYDNLYLP